MESGAQGAGTTAAAGRDSDRGRTPAQWFCYIVGATLVLAGILGFFADSQFDTGTGVNGDKLLGLEVNAWHNIVHIASGLLLLAGAPKRASARLVALLFAGTYALVTLIGFIDGDDILALLPVNAADNVLHLVLTIGAVAAALVSPADDPELAGARGGAAPA